MEGGFSADERTAFETHFLKGSERKDKLAFAVALNKAAHKHRQGVRSSFKKGRDRWYSSPVYLRAAAAIFIVLGTAVGVWFLVARRSDDDKGLADLRLAYKHQRLIEPRVSKLDYAPLLTMRGTEKPNIDEVLLRRAELQLLKNLEEHSDAKAHHALGRFYLAGKQLDKAIENLEIAVRQDPNNAQAHNDLGAALLEKGKSELTNSESGRSLEYFAKSQEAINKAFELDNSLLEALYNRAILHQYMMLPEQAEDDWRKYIEKDASSPWADEARRNLKLVEEKRSRTSQRQEKSLDAFLSAYRSGDEKTAWAIYSQGHASSGNQITSALLDSFLDSYAAGHEDEAFKSIQILTYLGRIESREANDQYTSDLARFYTSTSPQQRVILARARSRIKVGYQLFAQSKLTDAMNAFTSGKREFERAGNTGEAIFADYAIARGCALQPDITRGLEIYSRITPACEGKRYRWLLAECVRGTAHLQLNLNEYSAAIDSSARALGLSERVQDTNGTLQGLVQIADMYQLLKDNPKSLRYLQRGLALAQDHGSMPMQTWGIYIAIAFNFNSLGYYRAALDYQSEALQIALDSRRPLLISRTYEYIGLTYGRLELYDEGLRYVQLAYQQGQALPNEPNGLNMMANASLYLGDLYRLSGDHIRAVEAYDRSISLYDELGFPYYSYAAHKGKLLSYMTNANDSLVKEELKTVLSLFEKHRRKITEERQRNIYFDNEQSVYDLAIDFEYSRMNDPYRAFEYSEASRARSLVDLMRNGGQLFEKEGRPDLRANHNSIPLSFSEIQRQIPDHVQILQYAVLDNKLLIWVLSKTDFAFKVVDTNSKNLSNEVASYLNTIASPVDADIIASTNNSKILYDILIKPLEGLLRKERLLCIVPDKLLNHVPFGALLSSTTSRYLIEDYTLTSSPSSTVFIACSSNAKRKTSKKVEVLLSVGDPTFDHEAFPNLPDLPSAAREAEVVASYYRSARLLLKDRAQLSRVKTELERVDVAHFATHYVVNQSSNIQSKLLLARDQAGDARNVRPDNALEPWMIYQMELPLMRLVVLSGCQTGLEHQYSGEGPISLARPFLVASVPIVVASLWPVDSEATTELMVNFHRHRTRGSMSTTEALRKAQLDMLGSKDLRYHRPYFWASFVSIGGYAVF